MKKLRVNVTKETLSDGSIAWGVDVVLGESTSNQVAHIACIDQAAAEELQDCIEICGAWAEERKI